MRQVPPPDPLDYVVLADNGQRASVVLPDGTKVWLNSHTKLNYKSDYGVKERSVSLSGEAYFEVSKDTLRRFLVNAGDMEVEALGTAFNVKAYEEDDEVVTTLFEGSVRTAVGKEFVILSPDESAVLISLVIYYLLITRQMLLMPVFGVRMNWPSLASRWRRLRY